MPNWKYPCQECYKPVKKNQLGIECNTCNKWVHLKCTDLNQDQYRYLETNVNAPFYCLICKPRCSYADVINETTTLPTTTTSSPPSIPPTDIDICVNSPPDQNHSSSFISNLNDSTSSLNFSSANSSDFVYVDESDSDSDSRGLNFKSLPTHGSNTLPKNKKNKPTLQFVPQRTITYKYPCLVCLRPCKEKIHDSICCTLCDEWVHHKCTDLTPEEFKIYCSPDHAGDPYYCVNCLFGNCSRENLEDQICLTASEIESCGINDTIHNLCPNSVFKNKEDIHLSEYYTMEELDVEIKKLQKTF